MTQEILNVQPFAKPQQRIECMILSLQTLFNHQRYPMDIPQRLQSYLIVLFTKGTGHHHVDFEAYPYYEKTLLFVAENQVHQWEINRNNEAFVLAFSKEFLYKSSQDQEVLQSYRIFNYALQSPTLLLNDQDYQHFLTLFQAFKHEFEQPEIDPFKNDIYRNLLRTILLLAERRKHSQAAIPLVSHYQEFIHFREEVEGNFSRTRNVQDYASTLGYSPKKLNQLTQTILGKNAKLFIDERVVLEIKRLLVHTNLSIKEIADRTGFDEPTNLVKFFKRYTAQTPMSFRETLTQHRN